MLQEGDRYTLAQHGHMFLTNARPLHLQLHLKQQKACRRTAEGNAQQPGCVGGLRTIAQGATHPRGTTPRPWKTTSLISSAKAMYHAMAATQTPNQPALHEHTAGLHIVQQSVCNHCLQKLHLLGQESGTKASTESREPSSRRQHLPCQWQCCRGAKGIDS